MLIKINLMRAKGSRLRRRILVSSPRRLVELPGGRWLVPLSKGLSAIIDAADARVVGRYNWYALRAKNGLHYAARKARGHKTVFLHSTIMRTEKGLEVDHISGDTLDNRRGNLRPADRSQNSCNRGRQSNNTSGYKGVSWHKAAQKWSAYVNIRGRRHYLGLFGDIEDARDAHNSAALVAHGEFARLT